MTGWVLIFTILTTGQHGYYAGDKDGHNTGHPTVFQTKAECQAILNQEYKKFAAEKKAKPELPPFKMECLEVKKDMGATI
jgi:hypothetical protein